MPLLKNVASQVLAELGASAAAVQDDIVGEMCRWVFGWVWELAGEGVKACWQSHRRGAAGVQDDIVGEMCR